MDRAKRHSLGGLASLPVAALFASSAGAADAPPVASPTALKMTPSEQLMYSTVRIEIILPGDRIKSGTGFLFSFFDVNHAGVVSVVSNKHVFRIEEDKEPIYDTCSFKLTLAKPDGSPDTGRTAMVVIPDLHRALIQHPTIDLAIIPIADAINKLVAKGLAPCVVSLDQNLIPTDEMWKAMVPLENIVTVGYPGQFWDSVNYLPLFHRGSTASAPYINFRGNDEFVIDVATWPGASGSPVLILDEGVIFNARINSVSFGSRAVLLGIVYGVAQQEVDGQVVVTYAPTDHGPTPYLSASMVPTNLGVCIRSTRLLDFEPILARMGARVPPGYKMRASGN
jgi:hypothetical protein